MSSGKLASIIVNNFNYGRFVGAAIESALAQTYENTETIVVDDGSTDDSRDVISSYGNVIQVFKENGGQASAFTAGFRASYGDVIIFLDADDTLLPSAAEAAVEQLSDEVVVKVHWPLWEVDVDGTVTGQILPRQPLVEGDLLAKVIRHGIPPGWGHGLGHAYRRQFLNHVLPVRECGDKHGADSYLCVLAPIFGTIRRIDKPLGCYRSHGSNYARGRDVRYRLQRDLRRYPFFFRWISYHLHQRGISVDPRRWREEGSAYAWTQAAVALENEIETLNLESQRFILVDEGLFGTDSYPTARPMMENDSQYWGPPQNDVAAINELERQRRDGVTHIVFAATASWWLDYYLDFSKHLRRRYRCLLENEHAVVFDLRSEKTGGKAEADRQPMTFETSSYQEVD